MYISERSRRLARTAALIIGAIACLVMLGWITGFVPLTRVLPGFKPTQFNAALGFLGCALALHSLARDRPRLVLAGALLAAVLGGLTLLQFVLHVDLGIDQLLVRDTFVPDMLDRVPRGRMVAATAMLLLLSGLALAAWPWLRPQAFGETVVGTIGMITGAVAGITLLSYVSGLLSSLRFGTITGMGIPTSVAFIVIGATFVAAAWETGGPERGLPDWLAPAAGIAALSTTVIIWRALAAEQAAAAQDGIRAEAHVARQLVETRFAGHVRYLRRTARWMAATPGLTPETWSATVRRIFDDEPDLTSAAWVDATGQVRAHAQGREPGADFSRMLFLLRGDTVAAPPTGDMRVLLETTPDRTLRLALAAPVCGPDGGCTGHVVAHVDPQSMLGGALATLTPGFATRVQVGEHVIFRSDTTQEPAGWEGVDTLRVGGQQWTVATWPLPAQRRLYRSDLPEVVAVLGVLMSMLIAATLRFAHSRYDLARQAERERLEQALASSTDGVWEYDFRTGETLLGPSMLRRLGYEPHAITPRALSRVWTDLTHPEDRPRLEKAWEDHLAGRSDSFHAETRVRAQDGEWHVIVTRGRLVERGLAGEPIRLVGIIADVTERRRADEALVESEQRFRAIFDSAFQFEMLLDPEGRCLEVNRTFLDEAGLTRTQVHARPLGELWWPADPDRRQRLAEAIARARDGETVQYEDEVEAGGRRLVMDFSVKPIYNAEGQVAQLLAEGRDVTERKRAQDALREMDTLSTMGRLAARVAHEINNPLAGVQNSFLLIKDAIPADHPYYSYVGAIEREIARIASITRQLYETYRPESDGVRDASVGTVVSDSVAMLQQVNRNAKATIEVDTRGAPGVVRVPAGILRQAVYNLVQNAIEASPPGGRVEVKAWQSNGCFHLTVRDEGPGVPPEARARIFDPFFSTKSRLSTGGMGLGLALVHRSVTGLGGTVAVDDAPGGGALFSVTLPVRQPAAT